MKKTRPARWSRPSYSYTHRRGIIRRRVLPRILYVLAVGIPMVAAVYLANLQVKNTPQPTKANLSSSPTAVAQIQKISLPTKSVSYENDQLQVILSQFAATHSQHNWSIQLQGLGSDERSAAYQPTASFRSASIYKLLLMYPLIQRTPIDQWGSVELSVGGHSRSLNDCVSAMLRVSDNPCGVAVGDYVGWEFADSQLKLIGLENTSLDNVSGPKTTAGDVAYYLQGLYDGKWFDGATREFIIKTLDQQIFRSGIPAGCGSSCAVADKTGDLNSVRDDAGIIRYPGGAYVLSILSDGASYQDIAQLAAQVQTFMAGD